MAESACTPAFTAKRSGPMPLKAMLAGSRVFDCEAVTVLLTAYQEVVAELGLRTPEEKEKAAKLVIRLATGQTDLDAVKLSNAMSDSMLNEGGTDRPS
jgi:hypothetical protein